jgi:hypothetical protein
MNIRKRHILLFTGLLAILLGAALTSITVGRIYWEAPIYFYYYSVHPFMDLGIAFCALGGLLVLAYILLKLRDILRARKVAQRPQTKPMEGRGPAPNVETSEPQAPTHQ